MVASSEVEAAVEGVAGVGSLALGLGALSTGNWQAAAAPLGLSLLLFHNAYAHVKKA